MTGFNKSALAALTCAALLLGGLTGCSQKNKDPEEYAGKADKSSSVDSSDTWQDTETSSSYERKTARPSSLPENALTNATPPGLEIYDARERSANTWYIVYRVTESQNPAAARENLMLDSGYSAVAQSTADEQGYESRRYEKTGFNALAVTSQSPQSTQETLLTVEITTAAVQ